MGLFKQLIYTSTVKGYNVWGKSNSFPDIIARVCPEIFQSYARPRNADDAYNENPNINCDEYYPIRRKYSVESGKYILLRTNYLGREITTPRTGNKFLHVLVSDEALSKNPIAYFEHEGLFRTQLVDGERNLATCSTPLEDISDDEFSENSTFENLCDYINSNQSRATALSLFLKRVLYVVEHDNSHIVVYNAGIGDEFWNFLKSSLILLPEEISSHFTFDTHFSYFKKVGCLRITDKLIAFNEAFPEKRFPEYKEYGHKYITYDFEKFKFDEDGSGKEDQEEITSVQKIFALGMPGLVAYKTLLPVINGDTYDRIKKTINIVVEISNRFNAFPIDIISKIYKSALSENISSDTKGALMDIVNMSNNDLNVLLSIFDVFEENSCDASVVENVVGTCVKDGEIIKTVAAKIIEGDSNSIKFVALLKKYLQDYDCIGTQLQNTISIMLEAQADEIAQRLIYGEDNSSEMYKVICSNCCKAKDILSDRIKALFVKDEQNVFNEFCVGSVSKAMTIVKRYAEFSEQITIDALYKTACDVLLTDEGIKKIFNNDSVRIASVLSLMSTSCQNYIRNKFSKYILKNCSLDLTIDDHIKLLNEIGLKDVTDRNSIFKIICNKCFPPNCTQSERDKCIRHFVTEYVKSVPLEVRKTLCSKVIEDGDDNIIADEKERLEGLHKKLFTLAVNEIKDDNNESLHDEIFEVCMVFDYIDINFRAMIIAEYVPDILPRFLPRFMPHKDYKETFGCFLKHNKNLAKKYFDNFLRFSVTDSVLVAILAEYIEDPTVLELIVQYDKSIYMCLSGNGTNKPEVVFSRLKTLFGRSEQRVDILQTAQNVLIKKFSNTYGLSMFSPRMAKKYGVFDCEAYTKYANSVKNDQVKSYHFSETSAENIRNEIDEYYKFLRSAERNNKLRIRELEELRFASKTFATFDIFKQDKAFGLKFIKRFLRRLDLCNISTNELTVLVKCITDLNFDNPRLVFYIRILERILLPCNPQKVNLAHQKCPNEDDDWFSEYFTWVYAQISVRGEVSSDVAEALLDICGEYYAVAFSELMTGDSAIRCRFKGLSKLYRTIHKKTSMVAEKLQNSIEYMNINVKFRKKTDKLFADI